MSVKVCLNRSHRKALWQFFLALVRLDSRALVTSLTPSRVHLGHAIPAAVQIHVCNIDLLGRLKNLYIIFEPSNTAMFFTEINLLTSKVIVKNINLTSLSQIKQMILRS
jgi:hypothetical protein